MDNTALVNSQDYLKNKFPHAQIRLSPLPGNICLSVHCEKGEEWFERPILFAPDITQEQMNGASEDLLEWEKDIENATLQISL